MLMRTMGAFWETIFGTRWLRQDGFSAVIRWYIEGSQLLGRYRGEMVRAASAGKVLTSNAQDIQFWQNSISRLRPRDETRYRAYREYPSKMSRPVPRLEQTSG